MEKNNGYQGHCDFDKPLPSDEYVESANDWSGCQGTCDFEEVPNMSGWI